MSDKTGLTDEQERVVQLVLEGSNVFCTGSAGTGKTRLLRKLIELLREKHGVEPIAVTATTGIAAIQIGGQTVHAWAGIGIGRGSRYSLLQNVIANVDARSRWINCKALIVDGVSMLDDDLFETLEFIGRKVRSNDLKFGGIQLILCGDFQQLPPIIDKSVEMQSGQSCVLPFCFKSPKWSECIDANLELTTIFRQKDPELLELLNEVRKGGDISGRAHAILEKIEATPADCQRSDAVFLYPLRRDVIMKNNEILQGLGGEEFISIARNTGNKDKLKDCPFPAQFVYKIGAKVMLLRNIHKLGLANGSIGTVVAVAREKPLVKFDTGQLATIEPYVWVFENEDGKITATRRQLPLQLAWAITIHKSQGQTMNDVIVSLKGMFAYGQAYVALSRATTMNGLRVIPGWDRSIPSVPENVKQFMTSFIPVLSYDPCNTTQSIVNDADTISLPTATSRVLSIEHPAERPGDFSPPAWSSAPVLPSFVYIDDILEELTNKECRSENFKVVCRAIKDDVAHRPEVMQLVAHCWSRLEDIYVPTGGVARLDIQAAVNKSKMDEKTRQFLNLQRDKELKSQFLKLLRYMKLASCTQERLTIEQLSFFVDLIVTLRKHLAKNMLHKVLSEDADDDAAAAPFSEVTLDNAELAKIRYLGGWAISKVRNAAQRYIQKYIGSSNVSVKERVEKETEILKMMAKFVTSRDEIVRSTSIPETLNHLEFHNRGGLTHIPDSVFLFFATIEKSCQEHFQTSLIGKYQRDGLKLARKKVKESSSVNLAWGNLLVSLYGIDEKGDENKLYQLIFQRVLKRYLNMRSKEFVKKVKRDLKTSKDQALRQALTKKKQKGKTSESLKKLLNDLVADTTEGKIAGHLRIKAHALVSKDAFRGYTKGQLNFLFLAYDLRFLKSQKKASLSEKLRAKVLACSQIPEQSVVTQSHFEKAMRLYNEGKKVDLAALGIIPQDARRCENVPVTAVAQATIDDTPAAVAVAQATTDDTPAANIENSRANINEVPRRRLRPFRPNKDQEDILREDNISHSGNVPKHLRDRRAGEFSVQESQIHRWHKNFNRIAAMANAEIEGNHLPHSNVLS